MSGYEKIIQLIDSLDYKSEHWVDVSVSMMESVHLIAQSGKASELESLGKYLEEIVTQTTMIASARYPEAKFTVTIITDGCVFHTRIVDLVGGGVYLHEFYLGVDPVDVATESTDPLVSTRFGKTRLVRK